MTSATLVRRPPREGTIVDCDICWAIRTEERRRVDGGFGLESGEVCVGSVNARGGTL